ncbi:MAG: hypothetical protein JWL88_272 [Parcubacteria group bacterium]|nr:hypothetical protein [Parcubacteria group bacterium]
MRTFRFWHSVAGTAALVILEFIMSYGHLSDTAQIGAILAIAIIGSLITIFVATEVIEEVRGAFHMLMLLTAVVGQFVIFYAFQYYFLGVAQPSSFPTLSLDPISLILHSVMAFVFNPLYLPSTPAGRSLLLIETFAALGLVLFVLQNIGQFRRKSLDR